MFGIQVLDVAIGMALLFLFVSLICSAIMEGIEAFTKMRATDLEKGLAALFAGDGKMLADLFDHPLISGLFEGKYAPTTARGDASKEQGDAKQGDVQQGDVKTEAKKPVKKRASSDTHRLPSYIPANQFAAALIDLVARGPADAPPPPDAAGQAGTSSAAILTGAALRTAAAAYGNPQVRRMVLSALDMSGDDLVGARKNLESIYDGTMDRVAGWYKRRTQRWLFAIGLAAAILLNIDAIHVGKRLFNEEPLRAAAVALAGDVAAPRGEAPAAADPAATSPEGDADADQARLSADLRQLDENLRKIGYPIGWPWRQLDGCAAKASDKAQSKEQQEKVSPCGAHHYILIFLQVALGWLITAVAVVLGAPFWFDVLNKFMIVRSTVKPVEKSSNEKPTG